MAVTSQSLDEFINAHGYGVKNDINPLCDIFTYFGPYILTMVQYLEIPFQTICEPNNMNEINIGISPEFKLYHLYKMIDNYSISIINEYNEKNHIKNDEYIYFPIIGKYKLPYDKTHDSFQFKLFDTTTDKQEIKFKSFEELSTILKGAKVKFIISCVTTFSRQFKPHLNKTKRYVYKTHLLIHSIEITKKQYVNFNYNYEYIQQKLNKQLKLDIIALRYTPDKIKQLVNDGDITTYHLFI